MKLKIFVQPNAKRNEVVGLHGDAIKIKIKSPPVDGEANSTLVKFLSEKLSLPQNKINILHGLSGRNKLVEINTQLSESQIIQLLMLQD